MGFDELGQSLHRTNEKLRASFRRRFKSRNFSSPSYAPLKVEKDPDKEADFDRRMDLAESKRKRNLTLYLTTLGALMLAVVLLVLYLFFA